MANYAGVPYRLYALGLEHKHVPEITAHVGLSHRPLFAPAVGRYAQGMIEVRRSLGAASSADARRRPRWPCPTPMRVNGLSMWRARPRRWRRP